MSAPKKRLQKWKRREKQEQAATAASIYPHYHCLVCDQMIEKDKSYKTVLRSTDRSFSYMDFCSKKCYEEYSGKPKKKGERSFRLFYILIAIGAGIIVTIIILMIAFGIL